MEEKKKRGPKPKHITPYREFHLKFSGEMLAHIEQVAESSVQAYFDRIVQYDMQEHKQRERKP